MRQYLGTIVEKDRCICLQVTDNLWFPLGGNSGIASDFREAFNEARAHDVGKQVYSVRGVLQMENTEQMRKRLAKESQ